MMAALLYLGAGSGMLLLSLVIFRERPNATFFATMAIMICATALVTKDQAAA